MESKKMLSDSIWGGGDTQELKPLEVKPEFRTQIFKKSEIELIVLKL